MAKSWTKTQALVGKKKLKYLLSCCGGLLRNLHFVIYVSYYPVNTYDVYLYLALISGDNRFSIVNSKVQVQINLILK